MRDIKMIESRIQQKILQHCKQTDIVAFKIDSTSRRGVPDLLAILRDGSVLFIEVKTRAGRLSPLQKQMHTKLEEQNAKVYTVKSVQEFIEIIENATPA